MAGRKATWFVVVGLVASPMIACSSSGSGGSNSPGADSGGDTSGGSDNGGATGVSGSTSNGGASNGGASNGGASNGGASNGGASNGGASNGGASNGGGAPGGGTSSSGGATSGGGTTANGGTTSSGGATASGGTTAAGGCPAAPSGATATQIEALADVNAARLAEGANCDNMVSTANTSAQLHCNYYAANTGACIADAHVEVSGCTDFVAANFGDRMKAAGYTAGGAFEVMAFDDNPDRAVQMWIDSVWHRLPILDPWINDMGYGNATRCDTIDFGRGAQMPNTTILVYPYDGQTGVPTSFNGANEGPTPPAPPAGWPSGYPITVYAKGIMVTAHSVTVDGDATALPDQFLSAQTYPADAGFLPHDVVFYQNTPLTAGTKYRVTVTGTTSSGALNLSWAFTTK